MAADWGSPGCLCLRSWHRGYHCRRLPPAQVQESCCAGDGSVMQYQSIAKGAL